MINKSKLLFSEIIYKGFFNLREDHLLIKDPFTYVSVETRSDAVLILPVTPEGRYVLTLEYRYPIQKTLLSIAGGYIDTGETVLKAAARELFEETGYTAPDYQLLGSFYPYPGISSQKLYYVAAENATLTHAPSREPNEQIEIITLTHAELLEKMKSDFPTDGNLCTALFLFNSQ